ncbi:Glyco_tranf_GTA_type domain containing protein [uncultured Caudovirales phage]|uniref:Glyco_tranf_GTA_type domain containing protein n=1 Tax=uncultured Caudovirales phage TaxID=2100421 RepID=A0A6J5N1A0_9CAUD|nr:Glyco_tranf_GTA_type domain containing protein [uncultured Caudovirales phage]
MENKFVYIVIPTTPERRKQTDRLVESIRENTKMPHCIVIYENNDGGWVPAVHNAIQGINGYVVLLGSDVVVYSQWLETLWATFWQQFPNGDGAAQPYDEINNGNLCQHPLAHTDTIRKYLHPSYIHNFSDNEMTERLMAENKYCYVPYAKIEHLHWVNKKAEVDETYKTIMNTYERDRRNYEQRRAAGFPA